MDYHVRRQVYELRLERGGNTHMMGISGFKTKKELKAALGTTARFIETSYFGPEFKGAGAYTVVGPDPYKRVWYATVTVNDAGIIRKVT